jgi:ATP-dependent helicase/nuclease subunit B
MRSAGHAEAMRAIAPVNGWAALWQQVRAHMQAVGAHPAHTVVLLPFFQLQALARQSWTEGLSAVDAEGAGFMPRMETTTSWQRRIAHFTPDALDLSFDAGLDALRAASMLRRAGLGAYSELLTPRLVEAAQQLGGLAAALKPAERAAWAQPLRGMMGDAEHAFASHEAAVARIALEWATASSYAGDVLFDEVSKVQALVVVRGVQRNALAESLAQRCGARACLLALPEQGSGELALHAAHDAEDEAQRAAACVLAHLAQGRSPVALPAIDRQATRRISAMLSERGVQVMDETGWRLSTTRAAANLMSLLRAAAPQATRDDQLDWLKACAVIPALVQRWEYLLRKQNSDVAGKESAANAIEFIVSDDAVRTAWPDLLASLRKSRSISDWLRDLQAALHSSGQWQYLMRDAAGQQVSAALHLEASEAHEILAGDTTRLSLAQFNTWVQTALEGASFKPPQAAGEPQVVILPLAQLAARPFAAVVIAGADEQRLPAAPELPGHWTAAQRQALGLLSRDALALEQQEVWRRALQAPWVDVLWRSAEGDEPLQSSPLLQAWLSTHAAQTGVDAREQRQVQAQRVARPAPQVGALLASGAVALSASSYQDLRTCPYRYFALRLLGLQEASELDEAIAKRDFGAWLHAVLGDFHEQRGRESSPAQDAALLDACATERQQSMLGDDAGFVPFAAAWPQVRESYLLWLGQHESQGWRFESSELEVQRSLDDGAAVLKGRLDRVDILAGSGAQQYAVIDYKTESDASLKARVAQPLEDTQLIFYAALLGRESVQAAYLGLGEKEAKEVPQKLVNEALPLLLEGIASDTERMARGHGLPALGEGKACEYCAARGLCRKDFWEAA